MSSVADAAPGQKLRAVWAASLGECVTDLQWSSSGDSLAAATVSGPIAVFDGPQGHVLHELAGHGFTTHALSWHPQEQLLASGGGDGTVRLWSSRDGELVRELEAGSQWALRVAFAPGGDSLAAATGKRVRLWSLEGEILHEWPEHPSTVTDIKWSPAALKKKFVRLASVAYGGMRLWERGRDKPVGVFGWKGSSHVLEWSPTGRHIATGDQDSSVHFWILRTGNDLQMSGYDNKVMELAWDSIGRHLATGGGPVVTIWDCSGRGPAGSRPICLEGHEDKITRLAFQRAGCLLASGGEDGLLFVWDHVLGTDPLASATLNAPVVAAKWSPDDRLLATATDTGRIIVYAVPELMKA